MPEIRYRFIEEGADDVARGFQTVRKSATEAVRAQKTYARETQTAARKAPQQDAHVKARIAHERNLTRVQRQEDQARLRNERKMATERARMQRQEQQNYKRAIDARAREEQRAITRQKQAMFARRQDLSRQNAALVGVIGGTLLNRGIDLAGGAFDVGKQAVTRQLDIQKKARALSVSGRGAGAAFVDPEELRADAQRVARQVKGTKTEDILDAQSRYVAMTGDLKTARGLGGTFAQASAATGASAEDIAAMSATMSTKFGITDPEEMKKAIADAIFQGKAGAFEMKDAAQYFQEMGAAGSRFGLDSGTKGVRTLGGLAQLARGSTGSGAEASTAVQAMFTDLLEKSDVVKRVSKTNVFTDKSRTKTRAIDDVMVDILKGTKGDKAKLGSIFGERGMRGASGLIEAFNKGAEAAGKNATEAQKMAAGEAAVRKLFDETVNAGGDWGEVLKDATMNTQATEATLESAWGQLTDSIGTAVLPGLESLASHADAFAAVLEPLALVAGDVVDAFADAIKTFQAAGLLPKTGGDKSTNPRGEMNAVNTRLAELNDLSKGAGLTAAQRSEKRKLTDRRVELRQQLDAMPSLYMGTGDASGGGTAEDLAGMSANAPALAEMSKPMTVAPVESPTNKLVNGGLSMASAMAGGGGAMGMASPSSVFGMGQMLMAGLKTASAANTASDASGKNLAQAGNDLTSAASDLQAAASLMKRGAISVGLPLLGL